MGKDQHKTRGKSGAMHVEPRGGMFGRIGACLSRPARLVFSWFTP